MKISSYEVEFFWYRISNKEIISSEFPSIDDAIDWMLISHESRDEKGNWDLGFTNKDHKKDLPAGIVNDVLVLIKKAKKEHYQNMTYIN